MALPTPTAGLNVQLTPFMSDSSTLGFVGERSGLFTRDEVDRLMRVEFERARRYSYPVACLLVQVDRLEEIHTVHGYESKQEVLEAVVKLVRRETRDGDLLGYVVDDRLLVMCPHTTARSSGSMADRFLVAAHSLAFGYGGASLRISLSIGLAHNDRKGVRGVTFDTLRQVAEEGLRVADAGGGDRWAETELYGLYERHPALAGSGARLPGDGERDASYRERLEQMVARDGNLEGAVASLVEEIMARAVEDAQGFKAYFEEAGSVGLSEDVQPSAAEGLGSEKEDAYQREIDVLRRRVAKLSASLGLSEEELARLRSVGISDDGVASIYRGVQGLSEEDAQAEVKKALMRGIFEANLDLRRRTAG